MSHKHTLLAGLAVAALMAGEAGFADEIVVTATFDADASAAAAETREDLQKASSAAAEKAVESVLADVKLDLDIRLIGPTSVKTVSERGTPRNWATK